MPFTNDMRRRVKRRINRFIKSLNVGRFEGKFYLEWIGPDRFNYIPDDNDPFRFIRLDAHGNTIETIQPQAMETDGGSIPRIAQIFPGLSPWEYGPAYMIHDWEFEAHDLAKSNPAFHFRKTFKEVNETLAEAIWTLMQVGYLNYQKPAVRKETLHTIYQAVMSPIAKEIWDR